MRGWPHDTDRVGSQEVPAVLGRDVTERRQIVSIAQTQTQREMSAVGSGRSSARQEARPFWYVSDPRIRTKAAAEAAIHLAERVRSREIEPLPGEQELFVALHTAAYQISRPASQHCFAAAQRQVWTERWAVLRDFIVERNLGLVYSMIRRFGPQHIDDDDLQSEAMLALSRAVDRFNPWRGYRFSTYGCNINARAMMLQP
jgi:DNA-directed RNA polymerase sigma subunit (sigma70/sigma32)